MEKLRIPQAEDLYSELVFTTSRSSGPGGQNVNKVNSKVTLKFDVIHSSILTDEEKILIIQKLSARITKDGVLMISSQESRSQLENKAEAVAKLNQLFANVFAPRKKRKPTKPAKAAVRKRISDKKQRSEKKQWRQKPE